MKALVLVGGAVWATAALRARTVDTVLVVAADGGLRHAATLGVVPDLLVGDLDSVAAATRDRYPGLATEVHPPDKDALDLELALDAVAARGATEVLIVGGLSGRLDQTLATVAIAQARRTAGFAVDATDGVRSVWPLYPGETRRLALDRGSRFSLLALDDVVRVSMEGARYPLARATLRRAQGRGVSNEARGAVVVTAHDGAAVVVVPGEAPAQDASMDPDAHAFATRAVHAGNDVDPTSGAHATPIHATSTFVYGDAERGRRLFAGEEAGYVYGRIGNPTTRAFERRVASLEGGADAVAFASGMGAIAGLLLTVLVPGDEVVVLGPLYGGTGGLLHDLFARFGVRTVEAGGGPDRPTGERLAAAIGPRTKVLYVETPTNPTLTVHDLAAVAEAGRAIGALTVADNTFATPYLTRPLEHGLDAVLHSATKYLGGHGDALGGVLVGTEELVARVQAEGLRHVGAVLGPFEAFLLLRGLATLHLRVEAQCAGARRVAEALRGHPTVARVHYPGFDDHPDHAVAARQMRDFGGMVALELAGGPTLGGRRARAFLDRLELFAQAVSLGDVASLATHPATTTHELWTPERRSALGVGDAFVRLSVGVEDPDDLVHDVRRALDAAAALDAPGAP